MFPDTHKRAKKAGQPPGTPIYTGTVTNITPTFTVINYSASDFHEISDTNLEKVLPAKTENGITWVDVEGLHDSALIEKIATQFKLHPLTVEDILNVDQRPKVEEFEGYVYTTLKLLHWNDKTHTFEIEQLSLIFGKNFVLSFQENKTDFFENIRKRLRSGPLQRLRQQGSDYLVYRLIDAVVDQYFVVLEALGDQIEKTEELILTSPTAPSARILYRLKRQMLLLRKAVWPMREAVGQLSHVEGEMVTQFTRIYLRDVYDHTVQAIDTLETFRDMLSGMLDMYLSTLTNRMNEIMKTLTIITTIFIPITSLASIYGMNFEFIPGLHWRWGYPVVLCAMIVMTIIMMLYFKRKKWV